MPDNAQPRTRKHAVSDSRSGNTRPGRGRSATARATFELKTLQAFRTIFGSARIHDAEVRRTASISGSQLWALSEIARSTGMSVNALSKRMALHQTTASNLVNALVERKLIRRVRDGSDQRVVQLHVAAEGWRMLERAPGPHAGLLVDALRHLNATQLAQLRKGLEMLVAVIQRAATTAAGETLLGG
jgi:MarR family transcriptional regulator, organic hydroperoxide resistance regulator